MSTSAQFASTPKVGMVQISTANTARDGTGAVAAAFTAGSAGSRIDRIALDAVGVTTAGMVRLFLHDGTTARMWKEIPVNAVTPSATVTAFGAYLSSLTHPEILPLVLPAGYSLRASTHNAEAFNVFAIGGDL